VTDEDLTQERTINCKYCGPVVVTDSNDHLDDPVHRRLQADDLKRTEEHIPPGLEEGWVGLPDEPEPKPEKLPWYRRIFGKRDL
jgi:hypothetical protein